MSTPSLKVERKIFEQHRRGVPNPVDPGCSPYTDEHPGLGIGFN